MRLSSSRVGTRDVRRRGPLSLRSDSSSSPGVFQRCPSIEVRIARPLPDGLPSFGPRMPPSCSFRPCRSSRLRRLPPRVPLQVCCTLHPILGFGPFRAPPPRASLDVADDLCSPRYRASHPSELSPHRPPYRVTAALAFSPFQRHHEGCAAIPRLFSVDESVVPTGVATDRHPMLSWASFPSKVLPEFSAVSPGHRRKRRPLDLPFPELFARSLAPLSEG